MNSQQQQHNLLMSPNGSSKSDAIHETASNHSGHSNSHKDHHYSESNQGSSSAASTTTSIATTTATTTTSAAKKNFKTEYKSKFKPFSEYAYNEVTDSFVKCHSANECQPSSISGSRSNQDLSGTAAAAANDGTVAHQITISTHDADVFEPSHHDGEYHGTGGSVTEPWYKEVVKRNEKANQYRFKSEVGHNSPLLNYTATTTGNSRSESPFQSQSERPLTSPNGGIDCPLNGASGGDDNLEIRSQISDQQQLNDDLQEQQATTAVAPTKVQYRFTPHSYKRDNLISHMANNNNFNLPKEQKETANGQQQQQPRRAMTSSSQVRARSQSSRRTPISTSSNTPTVAPPKVQPTSKSNHTTPTRTVNTVSRSNITMKQQTNSTSKSHTKTPQTPTYSRYTTTTTTRTPASAGSGSTSKRTPTLPSATTRVTPKPASSTSTRPATSRITPTTRTTPTTTLPTSSSAKKTATPTTTSTRLTSALRPRTAVANRPMTGDKTDQSPIKTSGLKAGRLPVTGARAPLSSRPAASSSRDKIVASKAPEPNTAVKSIKTRKAIESDTAKAAAAAAAGVASAAGVLMASASSNDKSKESPQEQSEPAPSQTSQPMRFAPEEQNLIFTTTEAGDMLADELAQAELAQQQAEFATRYEQQQPDIMTSQIQPEKNNALEDEPADDTDKQLIDVDQQSGELINGLAGGLISTEDRFDSSERDFSDNQPMQQQQQQEQQEQHDQDHSDEPYSIIPTTSDLLGKDETPVESSDEDVPGKTFEVVTSTGDDHDEVEQMGDAAWKVSESGEKPVDSDDDNKLISDTLSQSTKATRNLIDDPEQQEKHDEDIPEKTFELVTGSGGGYDEVEHIGDSAREISGSSDKPVGNDDDDDSKPHSETPSQSKLDGENLIDPLQQDSHDVDIESVHDLMKEENLEETIVPAASSEVAFEPTEAPSSLQDSLQEFELLSPVDNTSTTELIKEPDSTIPAPKDIGIDTKSIDSDAELESTDDQTQIIQNDNVEDTSGMKDLLLEENETPHEHIDLKKDEASTDGLILNPMNLNFTGETMVEQEQRQKQLNREISDLDLMAQEDRLEGTVKMGDGSSAELKIPTSIENRVAMSTSKSTDEPDEPQANFKFARKISDDSEDELDVDFNEDPIGSAATLSPNVSVAEELMRFNAVKDNILDHEMNRQVSDEKYMTDLTMGSNGDHVVDKDDDAHLRNNNESTTKDTIQSVNVTPHVIDETVKQLSEQK